MALKFGILDAISEFRLLTSNTPLMKLLRSKNPILFKIISYPDESLFCTDSSMTFNSNYKILILESYYLNKLEENINSNSQALLVLN